MADTDLRRWVVLLRGINVGGGGRLPMAELRASLTATGFHQVRTYIQSGNIVLDAEPTSGPDEIAAHVGATIADGFGLRPWVHVLESAGLRSVVAANPYAESAETEPASVHYHFVAEQPPTASLEQLTELADEGERLAAGDDVVYLLAPNGVGRSKLAGALTTALGPHATARNHRSVLAVAALAEA